MDPPIEADEYILGVSETEAARLQTQHEVLASWASELWQKAGLSAGHNVLDVGCGPGFATTDMADIVGSTATVWGVDQSASYLAMLGHRARAAHRSNIRTLQCDVQQIADTPIPGGSISLAYARYILAYPPKPESVLAGVASKLRPGGSLVIQDFYNYEFSPALAPRSAVFDVVTRAVAAGIRRYGGDPDITGRLPRLLCDAGFDITHVESRQPLARPGTLMWTYRDQFYRSVVPRLAAQGLIPQAAAEEFFEVWSSSSADPLSFALCPTIVGMIAVRK